MIQSLGFILLNSASILLAILVSRRFLPHARLDLRFISTLTLHLFFSTTTILLLGAVGALAVQCAGLVVGVPLLCLVAIGRSQPAVIAKRAVRPAPAPVAGFGLHAAIFILSALLSVYVFRGLFDGTRLGWDDLSYHATAPAHWLQAGRFEEVPYNYHMYFPFGAELLAAWFMLPIGADTFANLAGLHWILLASASVGSIVYRISGHLPSALLSGAILLSSSVVQEEAMLGISSADLAGAAYVLAALYFFLLLPLLKGREGSFLMVLIAISAGLATGVKVTYAACSLVLGVLVVLEIARKHSNPVRKILGMFLFAAVIGSYWYVRNFVATGNPVFPAEMGLFKGVFLPAEMARTKLTYWLEHLTLAESLAKIGIPHLRFGGFFLGVTLVIGFLWACVHLMGAFIRRSNNLVRPTIAQSIAPTFVLLALMIVMYPSLPFSGGPNEPNGELQPPLRFFVLAFALGSILFGCMVGTSTKYRGGWQVFAVCLIAASWGDRLLVDNLVAIASGIAALVLVRHANTALLRVRNASFTAPLAVIGLFAVLSLWQPVKARRAAEYLEKSWGGFAAYVDRLPAGARLTWFGSMKYYQLFGRSFQHHPVAVMADGSPYRSIHDLWVNQGHAWWGPARVLTEDERRTLVSNIASQNIEFIVLEKDQASGAWPEQFESIETDPAAKQLFIDKSHAIFRIEPKP